MVKKTNPEMTYKQKKELIELKHSYMMKELQYERESARRFHELALTRMRIKIAEIRKSQLRKEAFKQGGG